MLEREYLTALLTPLGILLIPALLLWWVPELRRRAGVQPTAIRIAPFGCLGAAGVSALLLWLVPLTLRELSITELGFGVALALAAAWGLMERAFSYCRRRVEHPELLMRVRLWAWFYFALLALALLTPWTILRAARLLVEERNTATQTTPADRR